MTGNRLSVNGIYFFCHFIFAANAEEFEYACITHTLENA